MGMGMGMGEMKERERRHRRERVRDFRFVHLEQGTRSFFFFRKDLEIGLRHIFVTLMELRFACPRRTKLDFLPRAITRSRSGCSSGRLTDIFHVVQASTN